MNTSKDILFANIKAGVTVSLVSIPLSISLAVASGATPIMGIITAIWAGFFAAVFGGSDFNIVGPTGALSALLLSFVLNYGLVYLPFLAIVSGIAILFAYFVRAEKYLKFFPALAVQGFTLGVAFMIAFGQMAYAFGILNLPKHERFFDNLLELIRAIPHGSLVNFGIFGIVLVGLFLALKYIKGVPAAIIFSVAGIVFGMLSKQGLLPIQLLVLGDKFNLNFALFGNFRPLLVPGVLSPALTIATVAILETMISAKIADGMTGTKHKPRKEMLGLALANIASGLTGGMPATAALARTSLNIKSGASNRISSITNAIVVLLTSYFLFSYFRFLPLAVIAAILVFTAVRMVEIEHLKNLYGFSKQDFYLTLVVALICIIEDSIIGLLAGAVIGLLIFVYRQSKGDHKVTINTKIGVKEHVSKTFSHYSKALSEKLENKSVVVYSFKGALVYINGQEHKEAILKLAKKYKTIILRFRGVSMLDMDGVEVLDEILNELKEAGVKVYLCSIGYPIQREFAKSKAYKTLSARKRVFEKTTQVLAHLGFKI